VHYQFFYITLQFVMMHLSCGGCLFCHVQMQCCCRRRRQSPSVSRWQVWWEMEIGVRNWFVRWSLPTTSYGQSSL